MIWQEVFSTRTVRHPSCPQGAQGSILFRLMCGHTVRAKASRGRPAVKRCRECEAKAAHEGRA